MPRCILKRDCSQLYELLRRIGVDESSIARECGVEGPCQAVFDNMLLVMHNLNVDNAQHVSDFLKARYEGRLPIDSSSSTLKQIFDLRPFQCPELDIKIRQPCQVHSCSYWTNHSWTRNCIMFYRIDQGRDSLDRKELTFLLDQTSTEIQKRINLVLAEMRRWALRNKTLDNDQDPAPSAPEPTMEDCCMVCAAPIDKGAIHKQGFRYCGRECYNQKPPLDFRIEQEFHQMPVARVLRICIDSFAAKRPMCHALNVTSKQLDDLCNRYPVGISALI